MRSASVSTPRVVGFQGTGFSLEIEIDGSGSMGQVLPGRECQIAVVTSAGEPRTVQTDESGFFTTSAPAPGPVRFTGDVPRLGAEHRVGHPLRATSTDRRRAWTWRGPRAADRRRAGHSARSCHPGSDPAHDDRRRERRTAPAGEALELTHLTDHGRLVGDEGAAGIGVDQVHTQRGDVDPAPEVGEVRAPARGVERTDRDGPRGNAAGQKGARVASLPAAATRTVPLT